MKKYIFFIVGIGIILAGLLVYNVYNVQKENTKVFEDLDIYCKVQVVRAKK